MEVDNKSRVATLVQFFDTKLLKLKLHCSPLRKSLPDPDPDPTPVLTDSYLALTREIDPITPTFAKKRKRKTTTKRSFPASQNEAITLSEYHEKDLAMDDPFTDPPGTTIKLNPAQPYKLKPPPDVRRHLAPLRRSWEICDDSPGDSCSSPDSLIALPPSSRHQPRANMAPVNFPTQQQAVPTVIKITSFRPETPPRSPATPTRRARKDRVARCLRCGGRECLKPGRECFDLIYFKDDAHDFISFDDGEDEDLISFEEKLIYFD